MWKTVDGSDENLLLYYPLNGKKRNLETGEIEFDEQDVDFMLAIAMQHCNPAFIDGLQEQVERGKNNDNDKKE